MIIPPGHTLASGYVRIQDIIVRTRGIPMAIAAVEEKVRQYTGIKCGGEAYPLPIGRWEGEGRFVLEDGRHRYVAALTLGRSHMLVAWVEPPKA